MSDEKKDWTEKAEEVSKTIGSLKERMETIEKTVKEGGGNEKEVSELKSELKAVKESMSEKLPEDLSEKFKSIESLQEHVDELDVKLQKGGFNGREKRSYDEQLEDQLTPEVAAEAAKTKGTQGPGKIIRLKADITTSNSFTGRIPQYDREPGIGRLAEREPFIRDLIETGTTTSDNVSWVEETTDTDAAAMTAEGGTYGQGDKSWKEDSVAVKKLTEYMKVSEERWADVDFIRSEIRTELMNDLELLEDSQLLTGDGTGNNIKGIDQYATAWNNPDNFQVSSNSANEFDAVLAGITQIINNLFRPSVVLMHPTDVMKMRLRKDANNNYLFPVALLNGTLNIDALPVVRNTGVTQGDFYIMDGAKAKRFLRNDIEIRVYDQNQDDAINGLFTITAMMRLAFRIKGTDTGAFVKGTFADAIQQLNAGS